MPLPILDTMEGAEIGLIAYGSTDPALQEARHQLVERGVKTDYLRVRAVPFSTQVNQFLDQHPRVYVVEMNRDGQLHQLLSLDFPTQVPKLNSVAYIDGLPITASFISEAILAAEGE